MERKRDHAMVSRYSQGIYHPEIKGKKHVLGDATNTVSSQRPLKKSRGAGDDPTSTNIKPQSAIASARQSLKEKQLIKEKRTRKSGTIKVQLESKETSSTSSSIYRHVKSKVDTNRKSASITSNSKLDDSAIADLDLSCSFSKSVNKSTRNLSSAPRIHVPRNSENKEESSINRVVIKLDPIVQKNKNSRSSNSSNLSIDLKKETFINIKEEKILIKRSNYTKPSQSKKDAPGEGNKRIIKAISIDQSGLVKSFRSPDRIRVIVPKRPSVSFDPLLLEEYQQDIYISLRELELETCPMPNYIAHQPEISWEMRHKLLSWILEVHYQFKLMPETLYLTVNLIDRTLSSKRISINKLQLVGVTALLIASKYEEIKCPCVSDLVYVTDGAFDESEIIRAERHMLGILQYNLGYPNPLNFLRRLMNGRKLPQLEALSNYFLEVMLIGHQFLSIKPSMAAAVAFFLAIKTSKMIELIDYSEAQLLPCVYALLEFLKCEEIRIVYEKFALPIHSSVSVGMNSFMKTPIRKRLISKRGEHSDSSEVELIIEISDNDSSSYYTSSDEDIVKDVKETKYPYWDESKDKANGEVGKFTTEAKSWADDIVEPSASSERSTRQIERRRENKRYSSGFSKRGYEDHPMTGRWMHDMYQADSDEEKGKLYKSKSHKPKGQKKSGLRAKKNHSNSDFRSKDAINSLNSTEQTNPIVVEDTKPKEESVSETPRIRRVLSQASKNQLIASFARNPPIRSHVTSLEKKASLSLATDHAPVPEKSPLDKSLSDLTIKDSFKSSKENKSEKTDKKKYKKSISSQTVPNNMESGSHSQRPGSESTFFDQKPLTDQVVATQTGWALVNPSMPLKEMKDKKSKNKEDSKSFKNRRTSIQATVNSSVGTATFATPNQTMEKVTPVITQSGHMVLLTESGLCVPATQDMFQYQHWYSNQPPADDHKVQSYYYNNQTYFTPRDNSQQ